MTVGPLFLRHVHPSWVQFGRISSQVFRPTSKDEKLLSVYDGGLITAALAWEHFVKVLNRQSAGVMAVSLGECKKQDLSVRSDPTPYPEHAVIDFSPFANSEVDRKAKFLKAAAETRGWQHKSEATV